MTPTLLPAKSARGAKPPLTLAQHLLDTEQAAIHVFRLDGRWGTAWCRFFCIAEAEMARWLLNLQVAALFHDLGKANRDFVEAVTSHRGKPQTVRHEHLSALFLHLPEVRAWLSKSPLLDVEAITAAVLSHHMKASESVVPGYETWRWGQPVGADQVELFLEHIDVTSTLARIAQLCALPEPPRLSERVWRPTTEPWSAASQNGNRAGREYRRTLRKDAARRAFTLALKAGVVVADSVASGLVREGHHIEDWINEVVHRPPLASSTIHDDVLAQKAVQLEAKHGKPFVPHRFQDLAAEQGPRALLLAGCGMGKTIAAWRWAEAQAKTHAFGRVIFLYPTRGTSTEGFRDYVSWAPDAALVHGTSTYELEAMAQNPDDSRGASIRLPSQDTERLFALGYWPMKYFSATVDQFLSFLEHSYRSTCLLPALADSVLIVDEVHSFDAKMFESLVVFLKTFDMPVLCMTATLSTSRRKQLEAEGLRVFPTENDRAELPDLDAQEGHERYVLERVDGRGTAFEAAVEAYKRGNRVLVVVNRVAECQAWAREIEARIGVSPHCYHSRYRLKDRQRVHQATVEAFQQMGSPVLAVTTQVCEMSLDLDADVLITELAPPSSLIQRFGRANRHRARGDAFRARLVVYEPATHLPYEKEDLAAARGMLDSLVGSALSQSVLSLALEQHSPGEARAREAASFIDSGYYAIPGSFRDVEQEGGRCVLDRDLAEVLECVRAKRPYDGFVLSVPARVETQEAPKELPRFLRCVSGEQYDEHLGYLMEAR